MKVLLFVSIVLLILMIARPKVVKDMYEILKAKPSIFSNTTIEEQIDDTLLDLSRSVDTILNDTNFFKEKGMFEFSGGKIKTMSDSISVSNHKGDIETMSGSISVTKGEGNYKTMSGDILLNFVTSSNVNTMSGDLRLVECQCNKVKTMSGDILLDNTKINRLETLSGTLKGRGIIDSLYLQRKDGSTKSYSISIVNGVKTVNNDIFEIPKTIKVNKVYSDVDVKSYYPVEIIGEGNLTLLQ